MSAYEGWSLLLTAIYNVLTFGLLVLVAYESVFKSKRPNLAIYFQPLARDTKSWSWQRQLMDFVFENRGPELKNLKISSNPDFLGWGQLGKNSGKSPRPTSEYFRNEIPFLASGERHQFFWCDMEANIEILKKPFEIEIEFDNPVFILPKRLKKTVKVDFSTFDGVYFGLTEKYDIHNVAQEFARVREETKKIRQNLEKLHLLYKKQIEEKNHQTSKNDK